MTGQIDVVLLSDGAAEYVGTLLPSQSSVGGGERGFGREVAWASDRVLGASPNSNLQSSIRPGKGVVYTFDRSDCPLIASERAPHELPIATTATLGTQFTIHGKNLLQTTEVLVGGVSVDFLPKLDRLVAWAPPVALGPIEATVVAGDQSAIIMAEGVHPVPAVLSFGESQGGFFAPHRVELQGEPGHRAWLLASFSGDPTPLPNPLPQLGIGGGLSNLTILDVLAIGEDGTVEKDYQVNLSPPNVFQTLYLQAVDEASAGDGGLSATNVVAKLAVF